MPLRRRNRENLLDMRPRRQQEWTIIEKGDRKGLVNIAKPKFKTFVGDHFCDVLKRPRNMTIRLDRFGSFIWGLLDGKRTVKDVGEEVRKEFGEGAEPLFERLTLFLHTMEGNDLISMG